MIAIIAILAAILFPVFARARENARRSSCMSNLKQLGLGMLQYTQDYDEFLPSGVRGPGAYAGMGWSGQILPYVKSTQVFLCPSDSGRPGVPAGVNQEYYSYRYNMGLVLPGNGAASVAFALKPLSAYTATSRTVLLYEANGNPFEMDGDEINSATGNGQEVTSTGGIVPTGATMRPNGAASRIPDQAIRRHLEGSNFLAADGHAKWYQPDQISYGYAPTLGGTSSTSDEYYWAATGTLFAQGTEYGGADSHQMTMSYK